MKLVLTLSALLVTSALRHVEIKDQDGNSFDSRKMQETVPEGGLCGTMIPPSPLAPDDSSCWQWYTPPPDGILPPGAPKPPTGCDYKPCEAAVCECDSYCCDTAWDLSCRGYYMKAGDTIENNYFVPGCSAKLLCCEQESAFPDPPIGAAMAEAMGNAVLVPGPAFADDMNKFACVPGSVGCCDTMIPPSYLPPDDSTCWQWWDPPADGVMTAGMAPPPKGCDYTPCESAVCGCDPYCCETAWDLSCRGYHLHAEDTVDNNYFVDGCSAKMLCCEPESAYPDPPIGGAQASKSTIGVGIKKETTTINISDNVSTVNVVPVTTTQKVPVQVTKVVPITTTEVVPVTVSKVVDTTMKVPIAVGAGSKSTFNVGVNVDQTNTETTAVKNVAAATVKDSATVIKTSSTSILQDVTSKSSKKSSKKGCKGKGKAGKAGKAGKKGSSKSKGSKSKGSKSKGSKSSKCPDPTSAPTPPVGSPTLSPTATTTSTSTSTSTASLTTTATSS